jgi:hypothetical protein
MFIAKETPMEKFLRKAGELAALPLVGIVAGTLCVLFAVAYAGWHITVKGRD